MSTHHLSDADLEQLDRIYREGGLRAMASPHVHYGDPRCPYPDCEHEMEWIDFKLELHDDPEGVYRPLVRAWWDGTGFIGDCPRCGRAIRFTTLRMEAAEAEADEDRAPRLPDAWHTVAQFA